ncbi:MAG: InlB B-repeat-containing protein [Candidatus Promineifilaceae bacterium]
MIKREIIEKRLSFACIVLTTAFMLVISGGSSSVLALQDSRPLSCSETINIKGSGQVAAVTQDGREFSLAEKSNELLLPCGGAVTLTPAPAARWRFDHWQGVPEADRDKYSILVTDIAGITAVFVPRAITLETVDRPFINRDGVLVTQVERLEPLWRSLGADAPAAENAEPIIEVWHGDSQIFGQNGTPQQWVNILGNVRDPGGALLKSFSYTLNGGAPRKLSYGGSGSLNDDRRLINPGDFNIDIDKDDLLPLPSSNEVVITAVDSIGVEKSTKVIVSYDESKTWPIPYETNWAAAASVQDEAQVVDGKWALNDYDNDGVVDGVHPLEPSYDRIIAIGEGAFAPSDGSQWTQYEATVPVTIHGIREEGFKGLQRAPAVGVVMRWEGHSLDEPLECEQPACGYLPIGAASWYEWDKADPTRTKADFSLWLRAPGNSVPDPNTSQMQMNKRYFWKVRVDNSSGLNGKYYLRVWPEGGSEPNTWHTLNGSALSLGKGSLLLLAHHVDVTFGDVLVCPLGGCAAPLVSNVSVDAGVTEATLTWTTDRRTASSVDYWLNPGGIMNASDDSFVTEHMLKLTNLDPDMTYQFQIDAADRFGSASSTAIATFTTEPEPPETFSLTVTTAGQGTVSVEPDKAAYLAGEQVQLTAVPSGATSYFESWSMDATGDDNPLTIVISGNMEITATFKEIEKENFTTYLPMTIGE